MQKRNSTDVIIIYKIDLRNTRLGKHFREKENFYKQIWNRIYKKYRFSNYPSL